MAAAVLCSVALPAPGAAQQPLDPEPTFRTGAARTGAFPASSAVGYGGLLWRSPTGGAVISSPVVAGGQLFVGSGDGLLRSLDADSGAEQWSVELGSAVASTPAVAEGRVFAGARDGRYVAVDAATGHILWSYTTGRDAPLVWGHESGDRYLSSPVWVDGKVLFGGGDGQVHAVDAATGTALWRAQVGARVRSSPAVADGRVFVGSQDGVVHALDLESGASVWRYRTAGASLSSADFGFDRTTIQSSPAVADGRVHVGSRDGNLYTLDAATGEPLWTASHGTSWVITSPAVADGVVYAGSSDAAFVQALDAATGEELWRRSTRGIVWGSPAVAGDLLVVPTVADRLYGLDARTGEELWHFVAEYSIYSSPWIQGNRVYFASSDRHVYALRLDDGPAPERAVYYDSAQARAGWNGRARETADLLEARGYRRLDAGALADFLEDRAEDGAGSVLVFALDAAPPVVTEPASPDALLRRYLEAGGTVVWAGAPPLIWPRDPETGQVQGYGSVGWETTTSLLGVDHEKAIFDGRGVHPTAAGRRWGLSGWRRAPWGVDPAEVTEVLALDEWGLASSWYKSYGGPPGTGFVRLDGRDPMEVYLAAEHRSIFAARESGSEAEASPLEDNPPAPGAGPAAPVLSEYMDRMEGIGFSGTVLVARGDRILLADGYGLADREAGIPATTGTVFSMGSITKAFTATAILRLVSQGELSLQDSLGTFFPAAPPSHRGITVEQLLTHTSGLLDLPARDVDPIERSELERRAMALEPTFPPGDRYRYSNLGYSLLGAIVEHASGQDYEAYLRNELLAPAGIFETGYVLAARGTDREAVGYLRGNRWGRLSEKWTRPEGPYWILRANGGLLTTVSDLYTWVRSTLHEGGILTDQEVADLTRPRVDITNTVHQALGWLLDTSTGTGPILRHSGGNGVFSADVRYSLDSEIAVITFSNSDAFAAEVLSVALEKIARGEPVGMPSRVEAAPSVTDDDLQALAGPWQVDDLGVLSLTSVGDHLEMAVEGQQLVDALLDTDSRESGRLQALTDKARAVWEGVAAEDFDAARSILPGPDVPDRPFGSFLAGMVQRNGPLEGIDVLGTAPVWYASPYASWIRFRFAEQSVIRRIHWSEEGMYAGLGGSVYPAPLVLKCVVLVDGGCGAVHTLLQLVEVTLVPGQEGEGTVEIGGRSVPVRRTHGGAAAPGMQGPGMQGGS